MDPSSFDDILKVQRMMASRVMDESSMDMKIKLLNILRELTTGPEGRVQKEQLILEAQMEGISEDSLDSLLRELESDGLANESGDGFVRLI